MKNIFIKTTGLMLALIFITTTMAYSTNPELIDAVDESQIVQLVDDANTGISDLETVITAAADSGHEYHAEAVKMLDRIDHARSNGDELINTFLRGNYEVPIEPVPELVSNLSIDLTIHNLYQRRMRTDMPENITDLQKKAIDMLKDVQKGSIKLTDKPDVAAGQIATNKRKPDKVFTDEVLNRF